MYFSDDDLTEVDFLNPKSTPGNPVVVPTKTWSQDLVDRASDKLSTGLKSGLQQTGSDVGHGIFMAGVAIAVAILGYRLLTH